MARAIRDTYGLELEDLFSNFDLAIASYRTYCEQNRSARDAHCLDAEKRRDYAGDAGHYAPAFHLHHEALQLWAGVGQEIAGAECA
jgi:hypothetical protein